MSARTARMHAVALVVAALVLGLAGAGLLAVMLRERPGVVGEDVSVGGLELRLESAEWEQLQMEHTAGFQMPQSMMPGAPAEGDQRLRLVVELSNHTRGPKPLSAEEFRVEGPGGGDWPVAVDSLGVHQLDPGLAISGGLHFDLPQKSIRKGDPGLVLVWERSGSVSRIPVRLDGIAPGHDH
jgi:hypothetical protein